MMYLILYKGGLLRVAAILFKASHTARLVPLYPICVARLQEYLYIIRAYARGKSYDTHEIA